mmetsp:Transcript_52421/g.152564  ORF Transcript_52421/g.152564 Transcript_52421/m.152564 type:complete len:612 (+) Transcript_52421:119-1954(+)
MDSAASLGVTARSPLDDAGSFSGGGFGGFGGGYANGSAALSASGVVRPASSAGGVPLGFATGAGAATAGSYAGPGPSSALAPGPLMESRAPIRLASQDEFGTMMGDIRKTFQQWVEKAQGELNDDAAKLEEERQAFEDEKARVWQEFVAQKQAEYDRIRDNKKRAQMEADSNARQIQQERSDARSKLQEAKENIHGDVHQGRRRFMLEREKFRIEYEAHEKERQRISEHNIATETMVDINVGGVIFEAARHTLVQQPGSLLERLLTGRAQAPRDRDGRIFLDRDSSLFRSILNFLREPSAPPASRDAAESEALCQEADYLGIRFFPFPLVYAVGGHDGADHLGSVEVLDVENQCWRPCKPMGTERTYFGAEVLYSRMYLFGGQNLEYKALCETECFDCLRSTWMAGPNLNVPRRNCASAHLDGRIYAVGGFDGSRILDHVEAYDPRMKNWMPLEHMSVPRSAASATIQGGKLWVLGGTSGTRLKTVERYDPRAAKWESLRESMVEVRSAAQAVNCLDRLYVLGGTDQNQSVHASLECFSQEEGKWNFKKSMQFPRMDFGCCMLSDSIMVGGGQHGEVLDTTEFYRPELDDWQLGPPMLTPRYGHQLLLVNL